jgi:predicted nucleic acid-binding protein
MAKIVLIDSGAIVAALRRRDEHHEWANAQFAALSDPCVTCEAVLSESYFLLERVGPAVEGLNGLLERGIIAIGFSLPHHLNEVVRLKRRYSGVPMSFADACLVRMAEIFDGAVIFTTDRDFETYRKNGRQTVPLIKPW